LRTTLSSSRADLLYTLTQSVSFSASIRQSQGGLGPTSDMQGYRHASYAASLSEFGTPHLLPQVNGWILERSIAGFPYHDAMGCYPIFVCEKWSLLKTDLENIEDSLVCLSLVTDPFGEYDEPYLHECFPDVVKPFKQHFVIDLNRPLNTFVHAHHQRNARRALREVEVEKCSNALDFIDDWIALYGMLIERHDIRGLATFSRSSFVRQLDVPGIVAIRAVHHDETVGMLLWYEQDNRVYYHLGAYSPLGYQLRASFAMFDFSIKYFAGQQFQWLNLGAGPGVATGAESGLSRFKQGWSTGTRTAYFCGRVFDRQKYQEIALAMNLPATEYFPAYRVGEFN
jgi:hypothetical protein